MPNYTTTALVKASLGIPSGTTSEDDYIEDAIDAAEHADDLGDPKSVSCAKTGLKLCTAWGT